MKIVVTTLRDYERAAKLATMMSAELVKSFFTCFSNGEVEASIENSHVYHDAHLVIVQTMDSPINDLFMGIMNLVARVKKAGALKVTLVAPYCAYGRQKDFLADLLLWCGIDQLISIMMHWENEEPASLVSMISIPIHETIVTHIKNQPFFTSENLCLVAPDEGAAELVAQVGLLLGGVDMIVFRKERYGRNQTRIVGLSGKTAAKKAIIIDDMIDTGGTAIAVAHALQKVGILTIYGYFGHAIFSGNAINHIEQSPFTQIYVSDTLSLKGLITSKINQFSVEDDLMNAVKLCIGTRETTCLKLSPMISKQL